MRRVAAVFLGFGLALLVAGSALAASPSSRLLRVTSTLKVTGTVTALGSSQITVGRTTCSMRGTRMAELANSFAIGENVTVACVNGALRSIVLSPVTTGPPHPDLIVGTIHVGSASATGSGGEGVPGCDISGGSFTNKMGWTSGTISLGSGGTGPPSVTGTVCVSGTVTALDGGITVNDQTCPLKVLSNPLAAGAAPFKNLQVGDQAVMGCTVYSNGQSDGTIGFSQQQSA